MQFTHLHVHSHYSILDGMSKVPDIVDKCLRTGMPAVALTDHGNMYGIKELLDYCKKVNGKNKDKWEAQEEEAFKSAQERGETYEKKPFVPFKPIVGCEVYCARRGRHSMTDETAVNGEGRQYIIDRSGWHLILLAKNQVGYHNLCKIVSAGFMTDAFNYTARIDKELLEQYHEGIVCSSACLGGELPQRIMAGDIAGAESSIEWFKSIFGEDYYIEIQRHQTDKPGGDPNVFQRQREVNPILIDLAHKHGVKIICTNDAHFVDEENAEAHDRLICLSTNKNVDDVNRMHYTKQEWLKTPDEMAAIFSDIPEALANTQEIADKVVIYDIDSGPIMPKFPIPDSFGTEEEYHHKFTEQDLFDEFTRDEHGTVVLSQEDADKKIKKLGGYEKLYRIKLEADYLSYLTYEGAKKRYGETLNEEQAERIRFELHVMKTMGFPGYFLIVMDFIRAAREELGVSVGPGRGSAAGSVVAYCLHITDLDPLKYDLLFERFLNPDRISLPDIDTDFDDAGRPKVLDWVSQKYGETHVAHIITYGKMATRSAIADVGRVQQVPLSKVAELKALVPAKDFPENIKDEKGKSPKVNLKNCFKYIPELKQEYEQGEPIIRETLNYAAQLEDTVRQVGVHACGVIIGADDLTKFAPLSSVYDNKLHKRVLVTQYDGHVVESVGLIKMDFLGLITLTIIKECLKNIEKVRGEKVDIDHIPIDDAETYKLFQEGRTVAVFQFESAGMRKYMRELKPTVMGDLIAMNALYRPGPMDYIPQFIRRKQGLEPVSYDIPVMEKYLRDTYGVTVYQEQVMLLSRLLANFTRGESDKLRKAMGKKQMAILQELKGKFMAGGKANGHDEKVLNKIWADWEKFASYAFNKSHAACYSWVAYQTAYLKAHYPAEFMAANLTVSKDDIKDVTKLMEECKAMGIKVLEPDVNESELNFTVNKEGNIRFGLGGVKGVGEGAVDAIVREREQNGKYKNIFDFVERVNLSACNKKTIESLAMAGAFDCFEDMYREQLFAENSKHENVMESLVRYGNLYQQDRSMQQNSLFGDMGMTLTVQHPELPKVERWSNIERLNNEKQYIGIYLSAHPLDEFKFEIENIGSITAKELNKFEAWRTPDGRNAANEAGNQNSEEGESAEAEMEESDNDTNAVSPMEFIQRHKNTTLRLGGIITESDSTRKSKKGHPWGKYTIEDYTGSYEFALFGKNFQQFAAILQKGLFVMLSGKIQQRGADFQYFKEKKDEEAEFEFVVNKVEMLNEVQERYLKRVNIRIPLDELNANLIEDIKGQCVENPGKAALQIQVYDPVHRYTIQLASNKYAVLVSPKFYEWLQERSAENINTEEVDDEEDNATDNTTDSTEKESGSGGFQFNVVLN